MVPTNPSAACELFVYIQKYITYKRKTDLRATQSMRKLLATRSSEGFRVIGIVNGSCREYSGYYARQHRFLPLGAQLLTNDRSSQNVKAGSANRHATESKRNWLEVLGSERFADPTFTLWLDRSLVSSCAAYDPFIFANQLRTLTNSPSML
jgi:hypothetical protein